MKVLGIIGSPRKNGNTTALVNAVCKGAALSGHETEVIHLTSLTIHDCIACETCKTTKVGVCAVKDDMQQLHKAIIEADCLVLGTPIYMGQITGQMKNFFDRWYTFMDEHHQIHELPGKRYITVTASGAPAYVFQSVTDYLNEWLGGFFKMKCIKNIMAGDLGPPNAIHSHPELLLLAENTGRTLE